MILLEIALSTRTPLEPSRISLLGANLQVQGHARCICCFSAAKSLFSLVRIIGEWGMDLNVVFFSSSSMA